MTEQDWEIFLSSIDYHPDYWGEDDEGRPLVAPIKNTGPYINQGKKMSKKNTSKIYGPKKSGKKMTLNNSQTYVIGFYDMGMFDELQIMAHDKDEAREIFLFNYTVKKEEPYIARCETLKEVEERIKSGNAALPMDWQLPRFEDFSNKYYEALRK